VDSVEKQRRADKANALLKDPLLIEAFEAIEAGATREFLSASHWFRIGDQKRKAMAMKISILNEIRDELERIVRNGTPKQARVTPP